MKEYVAFNRYFLTCSKQEKIKERKVYAMDGFNTFGNGIGEDLLWGLPLAFASEDKAMERISNMSDEEREVLRQKSSQITDESKLDELVRMVAEGKFE